MNVAFSRDWAKTTKEGPPGISVREHCAAAKSVAERLLARFPRFLQESGLDRRFLLFLVLAHDVGKISIDFLQKSSEWLRDEGLETAAKNGAWNLRFQRRHDAVTLRSVRTFLEARGCASGRFWAAAVGAHHGCVLAGDVFRTAAEKPSEHVLEDRRQEALSEFWEECGRPKAPETGKDDGRLWLAAGFVTLSDWLASDEEFFPAGRSLDVKEARAAAERAVAASGVGLPSVVEGLTFQEIFSGRVPTPLQAGCAEAIHGVGTYAVEAPMGAGKTEAALWSAYRLMEEGKASGLYFALPTQATVNAMFPRIAEFARRICPDAVPAQMIHANSWFFEKSVPAGGEGRTWLNSPRRALFAPFGVGTVDQILLSVLAARHFPLRRLALFRKVVVIDEAHSYDAYTGSLVRRLCGELENLGCVVIVLSATLTEGARKGLVGGVGCGAPCAVTGKGVKPMGFPAARSKVVHVEHPAPEDALREAAALARSGANVLWICDTVRSAQETHGLLRGMGASAGLLHSRFPFFLRDRAEKAWLARFGSGRKESGAILVSTQVVEQSVDIDADALFSELAPTDMLLQRVGRLWRHEHPCRPVARPVIHLVKEAMALREFREADRETILKVLGQKAHVYAPWTLLRTLDIWDGLEELSVPEDIRGLLEATYAARDVPVAWRELEGEKEGSDIAARTLAAMGTNVWKAALDDAFPETRIGGREPAVVLCAEDFGGGMVLLDGTRLSFEKEADLAMTRAVQKNVVRVPEYFLGHVQHDGRLAPFHAFGRVLVRKDGTTDIDGLFFNEDEGFLMKKEAS